LANPKDSLCSGDDIFSAAHRILVAWRYNHSSSSRMAAQKDNASTGSEIIHYR
jgi:hypothetical protein